MPEVSSDQVGNDLLHTLLVKGDVKEFESKIKSFDPSIIDHLRQKAHYEAARAFRGGQYGQAIEHYTASLALVPSEDVRQRAKMFANRSICCLKLNRSDDALAEAKKALASDAKWDKAWYRAAQALYSLGRYEDALAALKQALAIHDVSDYQQVRTGDANVDDILALYKTVEASYNTFKLRRRYENKYERFENIAEDFLVQESKSEDAPAVEFAPGLTEAQKKAILAQVTGQYPEEMEQDQPTALLVPPSPIDLSADFSTSVPSRNLTALTKLLQIQYEATYGTRLLSFFDSHFAQKWHCGFVRSELSRLQTAETIVLLGFESMLTPALVLRTASHRCKIHLIAREASSVPIDLFTKWFERNNETHQFTKVRFSTFEDFRSRNAKPPQEEKEEEAAALKRQHNIHDDEARLTEQGAQLLDQKVCLEQLIPQNPDILVIDPLSLDGYLLGPRSPLNETHRYFNGARHIFPERIELFAIPARLRSQPLTWSTSTLERALKWSLLPQKLPVTLLENVEFLLVDPIRLYSLDWTSPFASPEVVSIPLKPDSPLPDLIIFYLVCKSNGHELNMLDIMRESPCMTGPVPHFWWLSSAKLSSTAAVVPSTAAVVPSTAAVVPSTAAVVPSTAAVDKATATGDKATAAVDKGREPHNLNFHFTNGVLSSTTLTRSAGGEVLQTTRPPALNCCDRYLWWTGMESKERTDLPVMDKWRRAVEQLGQRVMRENAAKTVPWIMHLETGCSEVALSDIEALMSHDGKSGEDDRNPILFICDSAAGTFRSIKGSSRSPLVLEDIRKKCWKEPATKQDSHWRDAAGNVIVPQKPEKTKAQLDGEIEAWLFGQSSQKLPLVNFQCCGIRNIRGPSMYEDNTLTPDAQMALCQLYDCPPDTPGLHNISGCFILQKNLSALLVGNPLTLPADGLSQGILPTVIFARRALLDRKARICPSRLVIKGQLLAFHSGQRKLREEISGAPTVLSDAPTVLSDAPTVPSDAPTVPSDAPTVPSDASTVPSDAPTVPSDAPTVPSGAPTVPSDAPTVPSDAPSAPSTATNSPTDRDRAAVSELTDFWPSEELRALRNPHRASTNYLASIPDAHRFHYGFRSELHWDPTHPCGQLLGDEPTTLIKVDFNSLDEESMLRDLLSPRKLRIPNKAKAHKADGILIWSEWWLTDDIMITHGPLDGHLTPAPLQFQLLPKRPATDLMLYPMPRFTNFTLTWADEAEAQASTASAAATPAVAPAATAATTVEPASSTATAATATVEPVSSSATAATATTVEPASSSATAATATATVEPASSSATAATATTVEPVSSSATAATAAAVEPVSSGGATAGSRLQDRTRVSDDKGGSQRDLKAIEKSTNVLLGRLCEKQDELAMMLGQRLSSSDPVANRDIGATLVQLSRTTADCESDTINNTIFAVFA